LAAKISRSRHVKDMLSLLRFVENPSDRVPAFRILHLLPGVDRRPRNVSSTAWPNPRSIDTLCGLPSPPRSGDDWTAFIHTIANLRI